MLLHRKRNFLAPEEKFLFFYRLSLSFFFLYGIDLNFFLIFLIQGERDLLLDHRISLLLISFSHTRWDGVVQSQHVHFCYFFDSLAISIEDLSLFESKIFKIVILIMILFEQMHSCIFFLLLLSILNLFSIDDHSPCHHWSFNNIISNNLPALC